MPVSQSDLKAQYRIFDNQATLAQVIEQTPDPKGIFLIVQLSNGKVASVLLAELIHTIDNLPRLRDQTIRRSAPLGDLLEPFGADPVEMNDPNYWPGYRWWEKLPGRSQVVVSGGQVVGVLASEPKEPIIYRSGGLTKAVLADEGGPEASASKKINIQIKDKDDNRVNPDQKPLQVGLLYTLILDAADELSAASIISDAILKYQWKSGEQEVTLTVRLESDDFEIRTKPQELTVPRVGDSNKVRFDLKPKSEGRGVVNVLFFKNDLFIQIMTLKFTIVGADGKLFTQESAGRSLEAAFSVQPRSLSLTILEGVGWFNLVMTGTVAAVAKLTITRESLAQRIAEMRKVIQEKVVYLASPTGEYVYQQDFKILPVYNLQALRSLAEIGYSLYREIFFGLDADEQTQLLGDRFREIVRGDQTLHIQIFSQHFMMPWGLLYMASEDEYDPQNIHPEWFLGLRHIIEHIPLQQTMQVTDSTMDSRAGLTVSLNVNRSIDDQMGVPLIAEQIDFWQAIAQPGGIKLVERDTKEALITALRATQDTTDQILYFYCHASSKDLQEGGPDASTLVFGPNDRVTLRDLKLQASPRKILPGEPLVFLNACESAELSPLAYDGFVPYFLAKGARGVIGTECEIPAVFAEEWAKRFFTRFLKGEPLGEIFLSLRKEFIEKDNNLLGLLYALYVDADTRIDPGFKI